MSFNSQPGTNRYKKIDSANDILLAEITRRDQQRDWRVMDSPLFKSQYTQAETAWAKFADNSFESRFSVLPEVVQQGGFKNFLKKKFESHLQGTGNAIELGGEGQRLFEGMDTLLQNSSSARHFFERTYGVTYKTALSEATKSPNHTVLNGNIMDLDFFNKNPSLPKKYKLIVCSMVAGEASIPKDAKYVLSKFEEWYEALENDGVILVTYPSNIFIKKLGVWLDRQIIKNSRNDFVEFSSCGSNFYLKKTRYSPKQLFTIK